MTAPKVGDLDTQPNHSRADAARFRITFAKTVHMRYTSQLDVQRTFERLLRRAEVPTLRTKGFHPRLRFNLAAALPLGYTGAAELAEVYLVEDWTSDDLKTKLRGSAPPGLSITGVDLVPSRGPAIQTLVAESDYAVACRDDVRADELAARVRDLLNETTLPRERRGKPYDLRPLIFDVSVLPEGAETDLLATGMNVTGPTGPGLRMKLATRESATGRPDEVLMSLGVEPTDARICRLRLVLNDPT